MHALLWVIDGLVAGWLTGKLMAREGHDLPMDIVMGMAGGIAGGLIVAGLSSLVHGRMIFTDMAAMLGGAALTVFSRFFSGRWEYGATN